MYLQVYVILQAGKAMTKILLTALLLRNAIVEAFVRCAALLRHCNA